MLLGTEGSTVALTSAGVTVLIDASGGRLPAIVYWGPALASLDEAQAAALAAAAVPVARLQRPGAAAADRPAAGAPHRLDRPPRPQRLLRRALGWSPAFRSTSVTVDGEPACGYVAAGAAGLEVRAVDDSARLELRVVLELLPA
nr:hypothetical protein GCM10020092_060250 [Actinoplanes digitatis]